MLTKIEIHKILTPSNYYLYKKLTPDLADEFLIAIQKTYHYICCYLINYTLIECTVEPEFRSHFGHSKHGS